MADAALPGLSADRRFATAYNAVLQLATIVLWTSGFRAAGTGHHTTTLQALPELLGPGEKERADYFDACRRKRNVADYDAAGTVSNAEADEILQEAVRFREDVLGWLRKNHPNLMRKS